MRPSSLLGVALLCLSVRLLSALTSGLTVFNPDEYWQSLEVAYARVWNGGFIPWEFQAHAHIRGWTHPALFGVLYWLLRELRLDTTWSVAVAPRVLQALFAAGGDMALFLLARRLFGRRAATWTLFLSLCSWFYFFCLTRTLSNSLECSLTSVALMLWPDTAGLRYPSEGGATMEVPTQQLLLQRRQYRRRRQAALVIAAFTFVIRPTSALVWLFLGAFHMLCSLPTLSSRARCLLGEVLPIGLVTLALSVGFDAVMYERDGSGAIVASLLQGTSDWRALVARFFAAGLPLVSLNFVRLNSGTELSALYGTHPFHWYFTEGLATNLGIVTPFFAYALWRFFVPSKTSSASQQQLCDADASSSSAAQSRQSMKLLLALQFWTLLIFSFNTHKEPRFILPVVPAVSFLLVGQWMASLQQQQQEKERSIPADASVKGAGTSASRCDAASDLRKRRHGDDACAPATAILASAPSSVTATPSSSFVRSPLARIVFVILLVNVLMAGYFCTTHQSGPARVFDVLQREVDVWQSNCRSGDGDALTDSTPSCSQPLSVHFLMNCHSMPLYSHLHVRPLSEQPDDRALNLHFLDCSPLFIDGKLHGNGSNPCSASAQFARDPLSFVTSYFAPAKLLDAAAAGATPSMASSSLPAKNQHRSTLGDGADCVWPWYGSSDYASCLSQRLGLDEQQRSRINNEFPGGGVHVRRASAADNKDNVAAQDGSASSLCSSTPRVLPHLLVIAGEHLGSLRSFLSAHGYASLASCFHSHLEDTKYYEVFRRRHDDNSNDQSAPASEAAESAESEVRAAEDGLQGKTEL